MSFRILDLFSGAGIGMYYARVFTKDITGVDIKYQKRYPYYFIKEDALKFLKEFGHKYDFIWASPPCQKYSRTQSLQNNQHPDYIPILREVLLDLGKPFVIENVVGAPLLNPVSLCGCMFNLLVYKERLFETSFPVSQLEHKEHTKRVVDLGRPPRRYVQNQCTVGNFSDVEYGREAMGLKNTKFTQKELAEGIPPIYVYYILKEFLKNV
jgi:DNA (cytosine-5)-methyltransferase 1